MYGFVNKPRPVWFHLALALGLIMLGYWLRGRNR